VHITAKVDYAVRTLVELAAVGPDPAKAEFLAKSQVIPHKFLEAGAAAFVGTHWEVRDESARVFAEEFYRALLEDGVDLGSAVARARKAIKDIPGDPTWLAYTLYGDPAATVV